VEGDALDFGLGGFVGVACSSLLLLTVSVGYSAEAIHKAPAITSSWSIGGIETNFPGRKQDI
jgi:hypothetical protein